MTLADLIKPLKSELGLVEQGGNCDVEVTQVTDDSRRAGPGTVFVAMKGERVDGHDFVANAVQGGASALVVQCERPTVERMLGVAGADLVTFPVVRVKDSRWALGLLASEFQGNPSAHLRMIGVTGTNGKTTVTYLARAVLEAAGRQVGLIGTVAYYIGAERVSAPQTTPEAVTFQGLLASMRRTGVDTVVMEVSSHALALDRTVGAEFDVAVYTNLTQDHLDFHADLEDYFQAKLKLFTGLHMRGRKDGSKRAIVNLDDPRADRVCAAVRVPMWTFSLCRESDLRAEHVQLSLEGTRFRAVTPAGEFEVGSRLVGEHNVYNLLAAIAIGLSEGVPLNVIQNALRDVTNVPGRFERVEAGQAFAVVVDYAHTEDALSRLLAAAEQLKTGRVITVFGCGGDRDRGKRPKMGGVAARKSDMVFLTSDNPRTESPGAILKDVEVGVREALAAGEAPGLRYEVIPDRRLAIEAAIREARPGDMVLIAGKGHEDYQIIGTERHHFDDREVARSAIQMVTR